MKKGFRIGVVGATGLVGKTLLTVLEDSCLEIEKLYCFASTHSAGKKIIFRNQPIVVQGLTLENFILHPLDAVFFVAGGDVSRKYIDLAIQYHNCVIDNSSVFRRDESIPLVVPDINGDTLNKDVKLIANPNCTTIQTVHALNDVHKLFSLKRVDIATYQAVSGSGYAGLNDLENNTQTAYSKSILGNCIPQIDRYLESGFTYEEDKMMFEINKIMNIDIPIAATCVRVPVRVGHCASLTVETLSDIDLDLLISQYKDNDNIVFYGDGNYPTPLDVEGSDKVHIARLRKDLFDPKKVHMWVVADNLRVGAATNAYEIFRRFSSLIFKKEVA